MAMAVNRAISVFDNAQLAADRDGRLKSCANTGLNPGPAGYFFENNFI